MEEKILAVVALAKQFRQESEASTEVQYAMIAGYLASCLDQIEVIANSKES